MVVNGTDFDVSDDEVENESDDSDEYDGLVMKGMMINLVVVMLGITLTLVFVMMKGRM